MSNCKKMEAYRQGEIVFIKKHGVRIAEDNYCDKGDKVIREGEQTGHLHEIVGNATLFKHRWNDSADMRMVAVEDVVIQHPEHADLKLTPGDYDVIIQREYDEEHNRYVQD